MLQNAAFCKESFFFACLTYKMSSVFGTDQPTISMALKVAKMNKVCASCHEYPDVEKIKLDLKFCGFDLMYRHLKLLTVRLKFQEIAPKNLHLVTQVLPKSKINFEPWFTHLVRERHCESSVSCSSTTQCLWPGLEPGLIDPGMSTLTMRPRHLPPSNISPLWTSSQLWESGKGNNCVLEQTKHILNYLRLI